MNSYSLQTLQSMIKFEGSDRDASALLDLFVPALKANLEIHLSLLHSNRLLPRSVEIVNDIVNLSDVAYNQLLQILYEDALRTRDEVDFVDPDTVMPSRNVGLIGRLFGRKNVAPMVMLAHDDPRHPCYLEAGIGSVEQNVKWLRFRVDEHSETHARLCLLDCYPRWEDEHGVTIVIRDGVPLSAGPYDLSLEPFDIVQP